MAEGKYGRLFTERDVALLVGVAYSVGWRDGARFVEQGFGASRAPTGRDELLAHVLERTARDHAMTFPSDEPLFLLRAGEPGAVNLLAAIYNSDEFNDGAGYVRDSAHYGELVQLQFEFSDWQAAHPGRVS